MTSEDFLGGMLSTEDTLNLATMLERIGIDAV
jgi:hypothetical protein